MVQTTACEADEKPQIPKRQENKTTQYKERDGEEELGEAWLVTPGSSIWIPKMQFRYLCTANQKHLRHLVPVQ